MIHQLILAATLLQGPSTVDSVLRALTVEEKVGQVIMPWLPGSYASVDDEWYTRAVGWIDSLHVGGIIVSIGSPLDIAATLNGLQHRSRLPLLIASDLEAGTSTRFVGGSSFPSSMGVAATGQVADAYEQGRITALEGRAVGVHMTFSPVADVNNNPENPIINVRSYGEQPDLVSELVRAYVRGAQDHGLYATAKHFPGHGDTDVDSHIGLPVLDATWNRLEEIEFRPFRAAVDAGVTAIMTAHLAVPSLSGGNGTPATMSDAVLGDVLRDSLGFRGVIVTDGLSMGAIVRRYGVGDAAVRAFAAGSDILLQPPQPREAYDALLLAVRRGRITEERLDASVRKIIELKDGAGLFQLRTVALDSVPLVVGQAENRAYAQGVAQRSIVVAKDDDVLRRIRPGQRVAVIAYGPETNGGVGRRLVAELRDGGSQPTFFRLWPSAGPASYDSVRTIVGQHPVTVVVAAVRPRAGEPEIGLPDSLAALIATGSSDHPIALVSLGNPYVYGQVPTVGAYVLGWRPVDVAEIAVARALQGREAITGQLPISIPPHFDRGGGIRREARH